MSDFEPKKYVPVIHEIEAIRFSEADVRIAFKDLEEQARAIARWGLDNWCEIEEFGITRIVLNVRGKPLGLSRGEWLVKTSQGFFDVLSDEDFKRLYIPKED